MISCLLFPALLEDKKRKEREKRVVHEGFKLLPRLLDRCIIRFRKQRDHGVKDDKDPLFIEEILL